MKCIKLFFFATMILLSACGTARIFRAVGSETISQTSFKVDIPFIYPKNDRIFVPVFFEKENTTRHLLFDTHAPFAMAKSVINGNPAYSKIGKFILPKPTPDGKTIPNIFYKTQGIKFGNIQFNDVVVNETPDKIKDTASFFYEGIFGNTLMVKGIWKVDFEHNVLTFASSIDSISQISEAYRLQTVFNGTKINVFLLFENGVRQKIDLDLGYSGPVILPKKEFDKIDVNHKAVVTEGSTTSAAGKQKTKIYALDATPFKIGDKDFKLSIRSTDNVKLKLMGLKFFSQFKFVVFDYLNQAIYVSNEKMPTK